MNEQKGNKQTLSDKSKMDNFLIRELKKRKEIQQQTKIFKAAIDEEKKRGLLRIENDIKQGENDVSKLEYALNSDDTEQIKTALKSLQI